mmetsp:Transcript_7614/g.11633  ORF Transcript_7614/g.11633 Transcript_7614/m.11633 type:complete len:337 (-) Transcript_7614:797-1807(-)
MIYVPPFLQVATALSTTSLWAASSSTTTTDITPKTMDLAFHDWCSACSIAVNPKVTVATTSQSVAGRGVFALEPLDEGEVIAVIPYSRILTSDTAAHYFPEEAQLIQKKKKKRRKRSWNLFSKTNNVDCDDDYWPAELTLYAAAALEQDHSWSLWIQQWQRDDPMHSFLLSYEGSCKNVNEEISQTAQQLRQQMPRLSDVKLEAAVAIRYNRWQQHQQDMGITSDLSELYSMVTSRAICLDEDDKKDGKTNSGIIPFYDMINHSLEQPNVKLEYDDEQESFVLYVNRKVAPEEELFLLYTQAGDIMDETNALWTLVQWGIPTPEEQVVWDEDNDPL